MDLGFIFSEFEALKPDYLIAAQMHLSKQKLSTFSEKFSTFNDHYHTVGASFINESVIYKRG